VQQFRSNKCILLLWQDNNLKGILRVYYYFGIAAPALLRVCCAVITLSSGSLASQYFHISCFFISRKSTIDVVPACRITRCQAQAVSCRYTHACSRVKTECRGRSFAYSSSRYDASHFPVGLGSHTARAFRSSTPPPECGATAARYGWARAVF